MFLHIGSRNCGRFLAKRWIKKLAVPITPFERGIISEALTVEEAKDSFRQLDRAGNGEIDVKDLA